MTPELRLPYLLDDRPPLGGRIKTRPDDFFVEEVPLYEPAGEGTHTYFLLEKRELDTMRAVNDVARALGVNARDIGLAGLKDANAVTRQVCSLEHVDPERIAKLKIPRINVLWTNRHTNKIRIGHLKGNRFIIKLRDVDVGRVDELGSAVQVLAKRGVPNYFGRQRFGLRGDTWKIGRAALLGDFEQAIGVLLGQPTDLDEGQIRHARQLYEEGKYHEAADTWPHPFRAERQASRTLARTKGNHRRAWISIRKNLMRFYFSSFQSYLFNRVVADRIDGLDRLRQGDLAWRHANSAVFRVEDVSAEQPRCDDFEISPSGPLFGYRMTQPTGQPGRAEADILAEQGLTLEQFRAAGAHRIKGARRPLRFQPKETALSAGSDDLGRYIELRFFLDAGCYATTLLRELSKTDFGAQEEA